MLNIHNVHAFVHKDSRLLKIVFHSWRRNIHIQRRLIVVVRVEGDVVNVVVLLLLLLHLLSYLLC